MKSRDKKFMGAIADLLSQQGHKSTTRSTPAPKKTNKRTFNQAEKYYS